MHTLFGNNLDSEATFFKPQVELATASTSTVSLDTRAFSVDSAASLHMMCKTDLSPEELETAEVPRPPTAAIADNR